MVDHAITGPGTAAPTGIAALATTYFWPVFWCLFALFALPAFAVLFLELEGLKLVPNPKLVSVLRLLHDQKLSYLTDYGTHFILPFAAFATLSATAAENRAKGFRLFLVFLVFLVACVVLYSLVWIQDSELARITYYLDDATRTPVTANAVCLAITKTYIDFATLTLATVLGIAITQ